MANTGPEPILNDWTDGEVQRFLFAMAAGAMVTVMSFVYGCILFSEWYAKEPIIKYTIAAPNPPGDGRVMENPSIKASGSTAIQCYAPATGEFLGLVNPASPEGIDRAIEKAAAAQKKWAATTISARRHVLRCIHAFILENQEEICRVACLDSGKTMIDASLGEILVTLARLSWTIKHGEKVLSPERRTTNFLMAYKKNSVRYEPLGVVAALVSWNYPCHNILGPIISSIFAGNGIVVKASENTAWSATYFAAIIKGALHVCGHDSQLVQTVTCWPQTANHLTSHPSIAHITFIGSRPVAKLVAASAAKALIPVVAELGGKDAAIVMNSAVNDLPRITEILLRGTFQAAGQNCIGFERIIALPEVYDKLVSILEPRIRALRVGSSLDSPKDAQVDVGAMVSDASFTRLEDLIQSAVKDGARLLTGGTRLNHPVHHSGHYFMPTLLVDVTPTMAIANEECFGPICVLMRASSAEDACNKANAPNFGLGASIFGKKDWEVDAIVKNLRVGMVAINDFAVYYPVQLPFGGVAGSGYGRFNGEEGLRGLCNIKAVCEDRWAWAGVQTAIPPQFRYPIQDTAKGFEFSKAVLYLGFGKGIAGTLRGLKGLWKTK